MLLPDRAATDRQHLLHSRIEQAFAQNADIDISVHGNLLYIRGEKRSAGDHQDRLYGLMERAYGRFERTIPIPLGVDQKQVEVSYLDGVISVILPKTETIPPR